MSTLNSYNWDFFTHEPLAVSDGAPGGNVILNSPANKHSELANVTFTLTTDANAADRYIDIYFLSGANTFHIWRSPVKQIASSARHYWGNIGAANWLSAVDNHVLFSLPQRLRFRSGMTLRIGVANVQLGDIISNIRLVWNVWKVET